MNLKQLLTASAITALLGLTLAAPSAPQTLSFDMSEMKIAKSAQSLKAGVPAQIIITNSGKIEHELQAYLTPKVVPKNWDAYISANKLWKGAKASLSIDGKAVKGEFMEVVLKPGQKALLIFTPVLKGSFELGCHIPGHYEAGMKNAFQVL